MGDLVFEIEGEPVPKGRPRLTRTGRAFTPARTVNYEAHVRYEATDAVAAWERAHGQRWPTSGESYEVWIDAWMGSHKRADVDNLAKSILDGLSGLKRKSVYGPVCDDDSDVVALHVRRHPHTKGATGRAVVRVAVQSTGARKDPSSEG